MSKERKELTKSCTDLLEFSAGDLIPMLEKNKKLHHVSIKYESLMPEKLGNDANRLLCAGLCLNCKHQSYKSDHTFKKTGICMVKFWKDKRYKLSPNKPVLKCVDFEPCT